MNYQPPFTITTKILNLVASISEAAGALEALEPKIITPKLRKENRIKTIVGTLEIEGNTLGSEKITALIEGRRVLGSVREVAEVQGAIRVYDTFEQWRYESENDLLSAHKMMMKELIADAGAYRKVNVRVGEHIAPPFERVQGVMGDLFQWLKQSKEHPLITSCVYHYEFEFIHPFSDGNGRMGRLWQSLILHSWKSFFSYIPLEGIVREHQIAYYEALEKAGSAGESTPFVEFMLERILETIENVPNNVPEDVPKDRGIQILEEMRKSSDVTVKKLAELCAVTEKTIKRDIEKLKSDGKIERIGSARAGYWKVIDHIE